MNETLVTLEESHAASLRFLDRPPVRVDESEDLFDVEAVGYSWTIGGKVYEPRSGRAIDQTGRRIGVFLLHGGGGDHLHMEPVARFLASRMGYRVVSMTFPGHLNLHDTSRLWPGDTLDEQGVARTPIWHWDSKTSPDEYEITRYNGNDALSAKYGTQIFARAREGTEFYFRMAGWPAAMEVGMLEMCRRNLPSSDFSAYLSAHSTGGPFVHALSQRLENAVGILGAESSPFGTFYGRMQDASWPYDFTHLALRSWRDVARYVGREVPLESVRQLPSLMEDVLDQWDRRKTRPSIKAQYLVHFGCLDELSEAAKVTARRLGYGETETQELVDQFKDLARPLPTRMPPILYCVGTNSPDHRVSRYQEILLPEYEKLPQPPKVLVIQLEGGIHYYWKEHAGLPFGFLPAIGEIWQGAIDAGFFLSA